MRVLAFTASKHRPLMLRHCIMQIKNQSYSADHVIYVNSPLEQTTSETSLHYENLLEDLCHDGSGGKIRIGFGPSQTFQKDRASAIRMVDIQDYDLFLIVDDDDIYLKDYVRDVVQDFEVRKWDFSGTFSNGHLNGYRWKRNVNLETLGLSGEDHELGVPKFMPPTAAFSRKAIKALLELPEDEDFSDSRWRRHLAADPGISVKARTDKNFVYNIHGGNKSTGAWFKA